MLKRKSQSAVELMSVYTWAFFAIVLSLGGLIYFGALEPDNLSSPHCSTGSQIQCLDGVIDGSTGQLSLTVRNNLPDDIVIRDITYIVDGVSYITSPTGTIPWIERGKKVIMDGPSLSQDQIKSTKKNVDIRIRYSRRGMTSHYEIDGSAIIEVFQRPNTNTTHACNMDGLCNGGETYQTCTNDCPPPSVCEDLLCDVGEELTCPQDCQGPICGNAACELGLGETSLNCLSDCPFEQQLNLINNGDFETGSLDQWGIEVFEDECIMSCQARSPGMDSSGYYSMCEINDYNPGIGAICHLVQATSANPRLVLEHGETYRLSFWALGPSTGNEMEVALRRENDGFESLCAQSSFYVTLGQDWTFFSFDCTATIAADEGDAKLIFMLEQGGVDVGDAYSIDSVTLRKESSSDIAPPSLSATHTPPSPRLGELVTVTASASDPSGIHNISLYIDDILRNHCSGNEGVCSYKLSFPVGTHTYFARATDNTVNRNTVRFPETGTLQFVVTPN